MTLAHRQRHRRLWLVLAVFLPLLLITGLLARRPTPVMPRETTGHTGNPSHP